MVGLEGTGGLVSKPGRIRSDAFDMIKNDNSSGSDGMLRYGDASLDAVNGGNDVPNDYNREQGCDETETRSITDYDAESVLEKLRTFARTVSVDDLLELTVVRGWLTALFGHQLPEYCDFHVEGLEDMSKTRDDFSVPIKVPILGPTEEASPSAPEADKAEHAADKIYHRRKLRSVADLMRETNHVEERGSSKGNKRKYVEEGSMSMKMNEISGASAENSSGKAKEEPEIASTPRERKRSRYLSPPYMNPVLRIGFKVESEESKSKTPIINEKIQEQADDNMNEQSPNLEPELDAVKMSSSASDLSMPVNRVLLEMQTAAIDPFYLSKEGTLDAVWAFISAFRSSVYMHGADNQVYQKWMRSKKRQLAPLKLGIHDENPILKSPKSALKSDKKERKAAETSEETASKSMLQPCSESAPDLMSDVQLMKQKFDIMGAILENYVSKFSGEEKRRLQEEMVRLMESVERASDKVRAMAERHKGS